MSAKDIGGAMTIQFQCGSPCRSKELKGQPCRQPRMKGLTSKGKPRKCRKHGGKNLGPKGRIMGVRTQIPRHLASLFEAALADEELLSLSKDVARIETFIQEAFSKMEGAPPLEMWETCLALFEAHGAAIKKGTEKGNKEAEGHLNSLGDWLKNGMGYQHNEDKALHLIQEKRKVAETEHKRLHALGQFITVQSVLALMARITLSVQKRVSNVKEVTAISADITAMSNFGHGAPASLVRKRET